MLVYFTFKAMATFLACSFADDDVPKVSLTVIISFFIISLNSLEAR